jgi:signal transduction histidine kinase
VATLEERQRLARELHDAVTQTLFSSALIADVLPELWAIDRTEGEQRLAQLGRLTRGALAEMRTLLVELRPGALAELPLPDLLYQLADATAGRSMLDVKVLVEGQRRARLPEEVHLAVYRMAQEALNNVIKHARARRARVALRFERRGLVLEVQDDGIGFEPRRIPAGHMGIGIMRERAQSIGARLNIRSSRGGRTCLQLRWTG